MTLSEDKAQAPKVLLFVASSPSDLTELESTARALAHRGHRVSLAYLYSGHTKQLHQTSLAKVDALHGAEVGLEALSIDVDRIHRVKEEKIASRFITGLGQLKHPVTHISHGVSASVAKGHVSWKAGLRAWMDKNGSLAVYDRCQDLKHKLRRALSRFLMRRLSLPYTLLASLYVLRIYRSYIAMFKVLVGRRPYQVIVVPEDVVGPVWPTLINVGLQRRIPTMVLPYTLANQEEAFVSLRMHDMVQFENNRLAAYLYPKWRMKQGRYDLVRMHGAHIFAHEWLRISPPDPWMMNSGYSKRICVDSQASFDYFSRAGIPTEQLTITGSHSQDQLARVLRDKQARLQALRSQLGLEGDKPLLLVSGCPNQLAGEVPACEFGSMQALAEHVGQALQSLETHYHLVVRPHPNYQEFGAMLKAFGVPTSLVPTAELVPLCDLFVAFASATIRWASACGIPTVNYDVFNYGYGDFAASKGVTTASTSADFLALMADMKPDSPRYKELCSFAQTDAAYWSVMDGQGVQRIEAVLNELSC